MARNCGDCGTDGTGRMIRFTEDNTIEREDRFTAILVGADLGSNDAERSLNELAALTEAAGGETAGIVIQKMDRPRPATYIGKGKVEEIAGLCENGAADTVIFDDELTGAQIRNLEESLGVRVIDRTILILDIFASRAVSKEGKLQVELAQLAYRMPRLLGFGRSLSRLGGGIGTRGPGEKKLETDRRHIQKRIDDIKAELAQAEKTAALKRKQRQKREVPVAALVGYTNVGKSALMNRFLTLEGRGEKDVYSEDMLFATLDAEQRSITPEKGKTFILSDTVGFVSKLPHDLIKAFRATLEEAAQADLLVHVADVSAPDMEQRMDITEQVLKEIGAGDKPVVIAYNKADLLADGHREDGALFLPSRPGVPVSAKTGEGAEELLAAIVAALYKDRVTASLLIPYARGDILSFICEKGRVLSMEHTENGTALRAELAKKDYEQVAVYDTL